MAAAQFVVHRRRRKETTVDNSIIWDKGLSNMARFVLIAILSLPETWDYSVRGMAAMLEVSKDTMGKYLRELEASGYLRRQQGEDKGKFSKSVYIITDTPGDFGDDEDAPCPKNYDSDCPNFSAPKKSPQKNVKVLENNIPPHPPRGGTDGKTYFLPLKDGTSYEVTREEINRLQERFPSVDVEQQVRSMLTWLEASPKNLKTRQGIGRFVASWLSRRADQAPPQRPVTDDRGGGEDYDQRELI